jgi:hypothetical protein
MNVFSINFGVGKTNKKLKNEDQEFYTDIFFDS